MKLFVLPFLGFAAVSVASSAPSVSATATSSASPPWQTCVDQCKTDDLECRARCVPVPSPNDAHANKTTECVAQCPRGNGTKAETQQYAKCVSGCVGNWFFSGTASLQPVSGSATASTGTGSASSATASGSSTSSSSKSGDSKGSASSTHSKDFAAVNAPIGATAASVVGLIMAALAM